MEPSLAASHPGPCASPPGAARRALVVHHRLPPGFLEARAQRLHELLDGPTLFLLPGVRRAPLFVSVLMHGNETSGLAAVQRLLARYIERPLPRSLMLFVGNVAAARRGLRHLPGESDYNRLWPGSPETGRLPEIFAEVTAAARRAGVVASIDIHNNTGRNPLYAVVHTTDIEHLRLAAVATEHALLLRKPEGLQSLAFARFCPSVILECGRPGDPDGVARAAHALDRLLREDTPPMPRPGALTLRRVVGRVCVHPEVSVGFGAGAHRLSLIPGIDGLNFVDLEPGHVLGRVPAGQSMPVRATSDAGRDITEEVLEVQRGELRVRRRLSPVMLTEDLRAIRGDCLCYLTERLGAGAA